MALGVLNMAYDKNVSPSGWYVGSYVLRFVELENRENDDPEARFKTWENTVLVAAESIEHAFAKVEAIGREESKPYKGGPSGIDVQWHFEGVSELMPVYEELGDGCEIMWADHPKRKLKHIRSRIRTLEELRR